ncbi:MAG: ComF family protein [Flavisolibacter sp.]|nr:ComF family protein [Flavisolibacter sp.]
MKQFLQQVTTSLLHLVFPHVCEGCGNDLIDRDDLLCLKCRKELPKTNFHFYFNNPIEKIFWGRLPLVQASAQYYFTKESMMQHLMHQLKYRGNKNLGVFLGTLMGKALQETNRFSDVDLVVPLPLFPSKEKQRGYNQAHLLSIGIAQTIQKPVVEKAVIRTSFTDTQTMKNRVDRWQNMDGRFSVDAKCNLEGKHVLLVDDVVTTGASLEACGKALISVPGLKLSICTLCYASQI